VPHVTLSCTEGLKQSGRVDAGALNASVWEKLVDTKMVDRTQVFVFWTTPPYV